MSDTRKPTDFDFDILDQIEMSDKQKPSFVPLDVLEQNELSSHEQSLFLLEKYGAQMDLGMALQEPTSVPDHLSKNLEQDAKRFVKSNVTSMKDARPKTPASQKPLWPMWLGWATAAMLLLCWGLTYTLGPSKNKLVGFNANLPLLEMDISRTEDIASKNVSGQMRWQPQTQRGEMKLQGLPINNPNEYQYQLWIFDAKRPQETPVDGGVFNIEKDVLNVIQMNPKIKIKEATLFAITIEQPGGVVVSKRERIVALAKI